VYVHFRIHAVHLGNVGNMLCPRGMNWGSGVPGPTKGIRVPRQPAEGTPGVRTTLNILKSWAKALEVDSFVEKPLPALTFAQILTFDFMRLWGRYCPSYKNGTIEPTDLTGGSCDCPDFGTNRDYGPLQTGRCWLV
jgi:hypothetical protein